MFYKFLISASMFSLLIGCASSSVSAPAEGTLPREPQALHEAPMPREESKKKITEGCLAMSKQVLHVRKRVCACVVANFDMKMNDQDMDTLAKHYEVPAKKDKRSNKEIEQEQLGNTLDSFDAEVATKCIANPKWRMTVEEDER